MLPLPCSPCEDILFLFPVCVARSKDSLGWTPIHLACYCGHKDVVEELLKVRQGCWSLPQ